MFSKRIVIILHLCVVFSTALWYLSTPFMYDLYTIRKRMIQTEFVMGAQDGILKHYADKKQKKVLEEYAHYFHTLPKEKQVEIKNHLDLLRKKTNASFTEKLNQVIAKIKRDSVFFLGWMILSVVICILYLKQRQGSYALLYMMPLLAFLYVGDIALQNLNAKQSAEEKLIPNEKYLVKNYLDKQKTGVIQKDQLELAWKKYLVNEWASGGEGDGLFRFQLAKFDAYIKDLKNHFIEAANPITLYLFLFWNIFVAIFCSGFCQYRKAKSQKVKTASYNDCGSNCCS